jgi:hypothetical protein
MLSLGGLVDGKDHHVAMQEFENVEACLAVADYINATLPKNDQAKCFPKKANDKQADNTVTVTK